MACSCPFLIQLVVLLVLAADSLRGLFVFVFAVSPSSGGLDVVVSILAGLMVVFVAGFVLVCSDLGEFGLCFLVSCTAEVWG